MRYYILLLVASLFFSACEDKQTANETSYTEHKFELRSIKNESLTVKKSGPKVSVIGNEGKIVILDFFATWCPSCKVLSPHLSNLQKKYKDNLLILGISIDKESNSVLESFSKEHNANYFISNSSDNMLLAKRVAYDVRQPRSFPIPLVVMYDTKGEYFRHYVGAIAEEIIERDILSAMGKF